MIPLGDLPGDEQSEAFKTAPPPNHRKHNGLGAPPSFSMETTINNKTQHYRIILSKEKARVSELNEQLRILRAKVALLQNTQCTIKNKNEQLSIQISRLQKGMGLGDTRTYSLLHQIEDLTRDNIRLANKNKIASSLNVTFEERLLSLEKRLLKQQKQLDFSNLIISKKDLLLKSQSRRCHHRLDVPTRQQAQETQREQTGDGTECD